MTPVGEAVVIGASMGGLLAARVLSETYAHVSLIDRDLLPEVADPRRGVPQGRQLHVLLARGREVLEELFPGLTEELIGLGVPLIDLHGDIDWVNNGHPMLKAPSSLMAFGISRPLLEHVVRERVAALPGVSLTSGCDVAGLIATPDARRIIGVRVRGRHEGAVERDVSADFVVDTSGRGSHTPVWLAELGYERVAQERVDVAVTYVTQLYHREPHHLGGLHGALSGPTPELPHAAVVAAQENNRFAVVLSGMLGEVPPTDQEGMAKFAGTLAGPHAAEIITGAVPIGDPATMKFPASQRRRYEKMRRFPDGLLVMADAICSFNPIYGQGMTVAALEALLLRGLIREGTDGLARRFFSRAARIVDDPWAISVGTDLQFPEIQGRRTLQIRFVNAYLARLYPAATTDPVLGAAFLRVINLIDPPARLLAPNIVLRVLRGPRKQRLHVPDTRARADA
jgi:2-polyprenyl-6-methoxyphenol hydroxylase-like FAD-dependent oxidoreductase